MADRKSPPVFLPRPGYRRRRIADAARILPLLGGVFVMLPLLWPNEGDASISTVDAFLYVFGIWFLMIGIAGALAPFLTRGDGD